MVYSVDMELRGLRGTKGDEADKQGWTGRYFFTRGKAKILWGWAGRGGNPLPASPQCGAGRARRGTYCVYQLIEIICCIKFALH